MRYIELMESMKNFAVFSINDIRKIDNKFFRTRLNEWQAKGYIKKIIKGYYIFNNLELSENVFFEIANIIYKPSYVSFESALSYYNLIPENPSCITSATSRKTNRFKTPLTEFIYRKIKPDLFFGYTLVRHKDRHFKMACIEKALLDYFYINPHLKTESDFAAMEINKDIFLKEVNEKKLFGYLQGFKERALSLKIKFLWRFMKNA